LDPHLISVYHTNLRLRLADHFQFHALNVTQQLHWLPLSLKCFSITVLIRPSLRVTHHGHPRREELRGTSRLLKHFEECDIYFYLTTAER
jgi:hypothetical protein